jgi:hypothetical protein
VILAPLLLARIRNCIVSFASSGVQRPFAPAVGCVSVTGSAFASSIAAAGGRSNEISGEAFFLAASSVVVGSDSSRRGFFLNGIT